MKLIKNGSSIALIVPRIKRELLKWKRGDTVALFVEGDTLIVRSIEADIQRHSREVAEIIAAVAPSTHA